MSIAATTNSWGDLHLRGMCLYTCSTKKFVMKYAASCSLLSGFENLHQISTGQVVPHVLSGAGKNDVSLEKLQTT